MNKAICIFTSLALAGLASGCFSDEPAEFSPEAITTQYDAAKAAEVSEIHDPGITFSRSNVDEYKMDGASNGKWEKVTGVTYGDVTFMPEEIRFSNNRAYTKLRTESSSGTTVFGDAIHSYEKETGKHFRVYIRRKHEFSPDKGVLVIGPLELSFGYIDKERMTLLVHILFDGGRTGKGGVKLEIGEYTSTPTTDPEGMTNLFFESVEEAYAWLEESYAATFGEEAKGLADELTLALRWGL